MKPLVTRKLGNDGAKNCGVQVIGWNVQPFSWTPVVEMKMFDPVPRRVKIDHIEWGITQGIEVILAWHSTSGDHELILPLATRGYMNFSDYGGLTNEKEGRNGNIQLMCQEVRKLELGVHAFSLFLDLIKQE